MRFIVTQYNYCLAKLDVIEPQKKLIPPLGDNTFLTLRNRIPAAFACLMRESVEAISKLLNKSFHKTFCEKICSKKKTKKLAIAHLDSAVFEKAALNFGRDANLNNKY